MDIKLCPGFIDYLKFKCKEYDIEFGAHPESVYEGKSVFEEITGESADDDEWFKSDNSVVSECPHCKFLYDTFFVNGKCIDRDYYLMTEVFVYLHGGDVCNWSDTPSFTVAQD